MIVKSYETIIMEINRTIKVSRTDLLLILNGKKKLDIPDTAVVSVHVPGGGDWSNTELELDNVDVLLEIRWTTVETVTKEVKL